MKRNPIRHVALIAAFGLGLGACEETLEVTNPNSGDTRLVLGTATDAENLVGGYYKRWHSGLYGGLGTQESMAGVMSFQNFSTLANNCLNNHLPYSGINNVNTAGNVCAGENSRVYAIENEVQRVASSFLGQIEGGLDLVSTARKQRDQAFAEFLRGMAIGYIALFYDSTAVITAKTDAQDAGKLVGYAEAMDSSHAAMQRAIDYANMPATGANGFPIPATWLPSPTTYTAAEFIRLIRTYRAYFRASVGRTPAEHNAANWAAIIADAQNGITSDQIVTLSNSGSTGSGMVNAWRPQYNSGGLWHQMPPFVIGMGDVSGSYQAWISTALASRGAGNNGFFMVTPDLRFPQGTTRAAQQADFTVASCNGVGTTCKRYFVNRPSGSDQNSGAGWGWSNYDHVRFNPWHRAGDAGTGQQGNTVYFTKVEIDMLQAEGLIRTGQFAAAAALINPSRVRNGLEAITTFNATAGVPGGANCVPQVPVGPTFTTTACGNMLEAMKWEKRMEGGFTHIASWFLDSRGWGDLAKDIPLYWATPFDDLLSRGKDKASLYGVGIGVGDAPNSAAARGTYGW